MGHSTSQPEGIGPHCMSLGEVQHPPGPLSLPLFPFLNPFFQEEKPADKSS